MTPRARRRLLAGAAVAGLAACAAGLLLVAADPAARAAAGPPAPALAAPRSSAVLTAAAGCGFLDVGCEAGQAVDSWLAGLAGSAVSALLALLGRTLLSTPQVGGFPAVHELWAASAAVADAGYVLLVLAGGILVMGHQSVQAAYSVKEIAPRLVTGFLASNLSLVLCGQAISLADGLSGALAVQGVTPSAVISGLTSRLQAEGGVFFVLLAVFAAVLILALAVVYAARLMLTVVLIAAAPLALACHALPQADGIARWWWRAFAGILAVQAAQALVLAAAVRVFLTEPWAVLAGPAGPAGSQAAVTFDAVQLLCLLYILIRIPFWIWHRAGSGGGRSPLRQAVRFVFAAAVLRRVTPALSGRARPRPPATGAPPAAAARPRPPGPPGT